MVRKFVSRLPCRGGVALSLALASVTCAKATTIDFNYTGSIVYYTVATTGVYDITSYGAQGGVNTGAVTNSGGLGAEAGGAFQLTAGQTLAIVVGGQGGNGSGLDGGGGGGGGSFVALSGVQATWQTGGCSGIHTDVCADTLLVASGGGGGAGTLWSGIGGQTGNDGASAYLAGGGPGGGGLYGAGAGGGYIGDGFGGDPGNGCSGGDGCGGKSFEKGASQVEPSLGTGGSAGGAGGSDYFFGFFISGGGAGGFGGGGGAGGAGAGGGGGGYTGGGGGDQGSAGGGGGSYIYSALLPSDQTLVGSTENGNGLVTLSFQSSSAVPEPSTWAMLILGFAGVGYAGLRRSRKNRLSSAFK